MNFSFIHTFDMGSFIGLHSLALCICVKWVVHISILMLNACIPLVSHSCESGGLLCFTSSEVFEGIITARVFFSRAVWWFGVESDFCKTCRSSTRWLNVAWVIVARISTTFHIDVLISLCSNVLKWSSFCAWASFISVPVEVFFRTGSTRLLVINKFGTVINALNTISEFNELRNLRLEVGLLDRCASCSRFTLLLSLVE